LFWHFTYRTFFNQFIKCFASFLWSSCFFKTSSCISSTLEPLDDRISSPLRIKAVNPVSLTLHLSDFCYLRILILQVCPHNFTTAFYCLLKDVLASGCKKQYCPKLVLLFPLTELFGSFSFVLIGVIFIVSTFLLILHMLKNPSKNSFAIFLQKLKHLLHLWVKSIVLCGFPLPT